MLLLQTGEFPLRHPAVISRAVDGAANKGCPKRRIPAHPSSGNPAIVGRVADRPEALRPRLSTGLPCFTVGATIGGNWRAQYRENPYWRATGSHFYMLTRARGESGSTRGRPDRNRSCRRR
jgi:hypothetical protein